MSMDKQVIEYIFNKNKDSFVQIIKAKHKNFYNEIIENYQGKSFSEKLYRFCYGESKCLKCGSDTRFSSFSNGFNKFCSKKCSNINSAPQRSVHRPKNLKYWIEKKCEKCGDNFWSLIKRNGRFCSNKCSTLETGNDKNRLDNIKQTKLERYGIANYVNPEKAKQTCLEKYGVDNASKSEEVKNKIVNTNLKKYGVEYSFQSQDVKEKSKQTNLERYGVENPSSSEFVKEKRKYFY